LKERSIEYLPSYYEGVLEMEETGRMADGLWGQWLAEKERWFARVFIQTADQTGIARFEELWGIPVDRLLDTEFRRERLLNRMASRPPFTRWFLAERLDAIIGRQQWKLQIDHDDYTLILESGVRLQTWHDELQRCVMEYKPCNMIYIFKPVWMTRGRAGETVGAGDITYNYTLGGAWRIGEGPFVEISNERVIATAQEKSITPAWLETMAGAAAQKAQQARINGTHIITEFQSKQAVGNAVVVEYLLNGSLTDEVSLLELLDQEGSVLSRVEGYFKVNGETLVRHTIEIEEGA